jgi:predicted  nucleic acid-binding Zn-ribbon protein
MSSSLEERVARIEGILEQMDKRLNHIESEVRDLRSEVKDLRAHFDGEIKGLRNLIESWRVEFDRKLENLRMELYGEIRDLRGRFYWIIGIQITMWVTIILTILFKHA